MAELKVWTCDCCNKEWNSKEHQNPLQIVRVCVDNRDQPHCQEWGQEWCKDCRHKYGLIRKPKRPKKPEDPQPEPPTLEEMVRLIVAEEKKGKPATDKAKGG